LVKDYLILRERPSVKSGKILVIPKYAIVSVSDFSENKEKIDGMIKPWAKVIYKDKIGWSFSGYLTKIEFSKDIMINSSGNLSTINGSTCFPLDLIPTDLKVCALNVNTCRAYCASPYKRKGHNGWDIPVKYSLNVPQGNYIVFSLTEYDRYKKLQGYYTTFVRCGMNYNCRTNTIIPISTKIDKKRNNINPCDWGQNSY